MSSLRWYFGTKSAYENLVKNNQVYKDGMYFIYDTGEYYYRGTNFMCNTLYFQGQFPADPVSTRVYFNLTTLTAYVHDGETWHVLVEPAKVNVLIQEGGAGVPQMITGEACKEYTDRMFINVNQHNVVTVSWNPDTKQITFERYVSTNEALPMFINTFATSMQRDNETGDINLLAADGSTILSTINIPVDNYIKAGRYDDTENAIVFTMTNGPDTKIYASDIINLYNSVNTSTITCRVRNINGDNFIEMEANVSEVSGNEIFKIVAGEGEDPNKTGLYANRAHLMDFISPADNNVVTLLDQEGNSKSSAHYIGGNVRNNDSNIQAQNMNTEAALRATKEDTEGNLASTYLTLAAIREQYSTFARSFKINDLTTA